MRFVTQARTAIAVFLAVCVLPVAAKAPGNELTVVTSSAFKAAFLALAPQYEQTRHTKIISEIGPSMGKTHNAIPARLERGEPIDVVILFGPALDDLIKKGEVRPGSRVDLARSFIGMAVKAGAPKPDIRTLAALKRTLLAAKSVGYSDSVSGVYLTTELFPKLGIARQMEAKSHKIEADPVGGVVAAGKVEIGFQQISELRPVKGIDIVGPLPPEAQKVTVFAAGIATASKHPEAARALIQWLASPAAASVIRNSGLEPAGSK